jgi:[ribosomal protein S5]-alanine N-acetyltransferase
MKSERQFPVIGTVRLKLRKPLQKDANALLEIMRDEIVLKYYGMQPFRSKSEALDEINWFNKIFVQNEGVRWVITEQGGEKYIGDIGFHNYKATHARAEIGFKLAKAYWHQGIMAEALGRVLEYGFSVMQLNRIEAVVDPKNTACLSLLKKAGFVEEGILREYEHEAKGYVDLVMLSLLKKDYKAPSRNKNL